MFTLPQHIIHHEILGIISGGGGAVGPGTANTLAKFTGIGNTVGDSNITDDGTNITANGYADATMVGGGLALFGAAFGGEVLLYGGSGLSGVTAGGPVTINSGVGFGGAADGDVTVQVGGGLAKIRLVGGTGDIEFLASNPSGRYIFYNPVGGTQPGILNFGSLTNTRTFTYPDSTGTIALTSGVPVVSDTAYDSTTWNANLDAPSKNAVRDKIEAMFWLDGTAQTLVTKTLNMAASQVITFQSSALSQPRVKIGPLSGAGTHAFALYDTSGVERTFLNTTGTLTVYDGTTGGIPLIPASAAARSITGVLTFNAVPLFPVGATFSGTAPTSSIGFTFNTTPVALNAGYNLGASSVSTITAGTTFANTAVVTAQPANTFPGQVGAHSGAARWNSFLYQPADATDSDGINGPDTEFIWIVGYNATDGNGTRQDTTEYALFEQKTYGWTQAGPSRNAEWFWTHVPPGTGGPVAGVPWKPWNVNFTNVDTLTPTCDITIYTTPSTVGMALNQGGTSFGGSLTGGGDVEVRGGATLYLNGTFPTVRWHGLAATPKDTFLHIVEPTVDRHQYLPDLDGTVVVVTTPQTYSASNVTTDRSYDANATTLDEIADVVGTLIADLRAMGAVA